MNSQLSPYNASGWKRPRDKRFFLCDVTARDGEQTVGVAFTLEEKIELATRLDALGIGQLQYAAVLSSPEAMRVAKAVCALDLKADIEIMTYINTKNWRDQVVAAVDCGADVVHALIPVSSQTRGFYDPLDDEATIDRAVAYVRYAKECGAKLVNCNMLDCPRVTESFFERFVTACAMAGIDRMRVNDTVGTATPESIGYLVGKAKAIVEGLGCSTLIGVHCHDDFGLATANTLAAVKAGADFADVAVNGLGERAGNADFAEVSVALTLLYGLDCGVKLEELYGLSRYVAGISGIPVADGKSIIGDLVFSDQSDKHNAAFEANPFAFQGILPETVGNRRRVMIGKKSGPYTLQLKLKELSLSLPESKEVLALEALQRAAASFRGKPLPEAECERILMELGAVRKP